MKPIRLNDFGLLIAGFIAIGYLGAAHAQQGYYYGPAPTSAGASTPQVVTWTTSAATDPIEITNSSGKPINVTITLDKADISVGVDVRNCGNIRHINPGSSVICVTNDPNNPISLTPDNQAKTASGTYVIYPNCT